MRYQALMSVVYG